MEKIEHGVPLYAPISGRKTNHPFRDMEIGDSFWTARAVSTSQWGNVTGRKFSRRKEIQDGVMGMRIWRIA